MVQEKEEQNIKKMAQLLREGATMLDLTCPQCDNIIFKLKTGNKYCPTCNKEVFYENEFKIIKQKDLSEEKKDERNLINEKMIIRDKINKISILIANNEQISMIKDLLDVLDKLLDVYQKLSNIEQI